MAAAAPPPGPPAPQPIHRAISARVRDLARGFPVLTITGPRQSGKSTLCRAVFADKPYANLESPDVRRHAVEDPRGFLSRFPHGAVLDEIQRAPELTSYLQPMVDENPVPGQWILTGSQHGLLRDTVSQSLAGRNAPVELLPLAAREMEAFPRPPGDVWTAVHRGGFPPLSVRDVTPFDWLNAYVATYLERDVREIRAIGDYHAFHTLLRLVAARTAQLLNVSALATDAGVTVSTARAWLSVLEVTYAIRLLLPTMSNIRKRQVKARKVHMLDSGLACTLAGIRSPDELALHSMRGAIFESFVHSEIAKWCDARRPDVRIGYFRDDHGGEIDLVLESSSTITLIEVKSGQTITPEWASAVTRLAVHFDADGGGTQRQEKQRPMEPRRAVRRMVIYAGSEQVSLRGAEFVPWNRVWDALDAGMEPSGLRGSGAG